MTPFATVTASSLLWICRSFIARRISDSCMCGMGSCRAQASMMHAQSLSSGKDVRPTMRGAKVENLSEKSPSSSATSEKAPFRIAKRMRRASRIASRSSKFNSDLSSLRCSNRLRRGIDNMQCAAGPSSRVDFTPDVQNCGCWAACLLT